MEFYIDSPCHPDNAVCGTAFTAFATHQEKIKEFIVIYNKFHDCMDMSEVAAYVGLDTSLLDDVDIDYIKSHLNIR